MGGVIRFVIVLLAGVALCGCQTMSDPTLISSSALQDLPPSGAETIARDLTGRLVEELGVGTTTISLDSDGSMFGQAFEDALRAEGFAISTDQSVGSNSSFLPLAYVVDRFETNLLVRLSTPSLHLTRIYAISAQDVEPISPWSMMATERGETQ